MSNIVTKIADFPSFRALTGATDEQIENAETALSVQFSDEYCEYISAYGIATIFGHEFTGICDFPRLNVVDVTSFERNRTPTARAEWYVIEQANIDGIVIWQSSNGEVYQTIPNTDSIKLCDSLCEYLDL